MGSRFLPPPALPSWLEEELPFNKKLFPDAEAVETDAGHFLQEEAPEELAAAVLQVADEA